LRYTRGEGAAKGKVPLFHLYMLLAPVRLCSLPLGVLLLLLLLLLLLRDERSCTQPLTLCPRA
jgi:hypothetical protein